jgi:threonine dehydrogenase-like Zn-dependent dehydrogenase/predicted dehydrogenase
VKQLLQNFKTGVTELLVCPQPICKKGTLLIRTHVSLVSLGTERMLVEFGKSNMIQKALQQPERVRQVIEKMKSEGVLSTFHSISNRLDEPIPLGYCNAGVVEQVGDGVTGFAIGDRVVSNGPHAEVVVVPKNLVAKIPDDTISFEHASFTVAGSIGLQGIRLAAPTLGETVVIFGLGLIGQLTAQLAKAHGCRVIAFEIDPSKVTLAAHFGIEARISPDPVSSVMEFTGNHGADCVIITASTSVDGIISQSARMSRKRGRIVLVGVVPLTINRAEFYEKELSFTVSCSYGPGRYDPEYEAAGNDYPLPFVRWTEQRNFEAVLHCMRNKLIDVEPLITERIPFDDAPAFYAEMDSRASVASIFTYTKFPEKKSEQKLSGVMNLQKQNGATGIAVVGTGNFAKMTLLPTLKKIAVPVEWCCGQTVATVAYCARRFSIPKMTTDCDQVLGDAGVKVVFITTRHRSHVDLCIKALDAGKFVFVEKPLAVNRDQLNRLVDFIECHSVSEGALAVGFNRRYSPLITQIRQYMGEKPPQLNFVFTMNAGAIPATHWLQQASEGGRIIGEACHCIDLFQYLAASPITSVCATSMGMEADLLSDNVSILIRTKNGSQGVVNYFANGSRLHSKEKFMLYFEGKVIEVDNFRSLKWYGIRRKNIKMLTPDKGHLNQFKTYADFIKGNAKLRSSIREHLNVTDASIAVVESLLHRTWIDVGNSW